MTANKPINRTNVQTRGNNSRLAGQPHGKKVHPYGKGTYKDLLNKTTTKGNQDGHRSKQGIIECLAKMTPIRLIDAISSLVFIMAFALFNYIYWCNIVD